MHYVHGQSNICTYISQSPRLIGAAWEGLMNRVSWCWHWVLNTRFGQVAFNPLWQRYIVPLDQRDKSMLQKTYVLVLAIAILGRHLFNPALMPIIFLLPAALIVGGYKLVESRAQTRSNRTQIIPCLDEALESVRQTNHESDYPRTLDTLSNALKQTEFSYLKDYAGHYDGIRKTFKNAYRRRSIATIRREMIDYTIQRGVNTLPVVVNFIDALDVVVQNDNEDARNALQEAYQAVLRGLEQLPNQNQAQQQINWISRRMNEINQPAFGTCQNNLIEGLAELRRKLDESPHPLSLICHIQSITNNSR